MSNAHTRTAKEIESILLNAIDMHGPENLAKAVGVNRTQMVRWKETHVPKFALFLAYIGYNVPDHDLTRLAKEVAQLLIEEMRSDADKN